MNAIAEAKRPLAVVWRVVGGAVVGAGGALLFVELVGKRNLDLDNPAVVLAVTAGLIYAFIGAFVGLGLIVPRTGAQFLNVEDAAELREERPKLTFGAVICILVGAFLLLLAWANDAAQSSHDVAIYCAAACLIAVVVLGFMSRTRSDELTRQMNFEASTLTLQVGLVALGIAALATKSIGWLTPLAAISAVALLQLVSVWTVAIRKGVFMRNKHFRL